jgi:predicted RNase H-like HicB family nuclease
MKIIAIKDPKDRGYTAFHADFPSVVIQTETTEEIKQHLIDVFHDIIMGSEIFETELKEEKPK